MDSRKRKLPPLGLERRVRARAEPEPGFDDFENETDNSAPSEEGFDEDRLGSDCSSEDDAGAVEADESGGSSNEEDEDMSADVSKVSFGALAKAQAMLPQSGRRKKKVAQADDGPDEEDTSSKPRGPPSKREKPPSRSSKHAPMEMSSKRQVSRKRDILPVKKIEARDPRFDPLITSRSSSHTSGRADEDRARKAYAFLDEYRDDEMRQIKSAVKKAKNPMEKEKLQRALMSMESRKKARDRRDRERAVIEEHRRKEKELVKEGKKAKPFYLKKSEQKKQLLVDQFSGLSEKQRDKAIERRRKKVAGKEKKELPLKRRGME